MKRFGPLLGLAAVIALLFFMGLPMKAFAQTTADVTVNATPAYVSIAVNNSVYSYGVVAASSTPSTITNYFLITNGSTVVTNQTVSVTTSTWSGGVTWTHSDTATAGADTAGLKANKGGTWGAGDVIVKFSAPNNLALNQAATTNYNFGLMLIAPTSFGDGVLKQIVVRITAVAA